MADRYTYAFGIAFSVTALFSALLVLLKELNPGVLVWMTTLTGHHWATHSLFDFSLFIVLGLLLLLKTPGTTQTLTFLVASSTILSTLIITAFFLPK